MTQASLSSARVGHPHKVHRPLRPSGALSDLGAHRARHRGLPERIEEVRSGLEEQVAPGWEGKLKGLGGEVLAAKEPELNRAVAKSHRQLLKAEIGIGRLPRKEGQEHSAPRKQSGFRLG
mgnify:CR=1 FL=1